MAKLIVNRKKLLPGCFMHLHILVGGKIVLSLKNGGSGECEVPDEPAHVRCSLTLGRASNVYLVDFSAQPEVHVTAWANTRFPVLDFADAQGEPLRVEQEVSDRLPDFLY